MDFLKPEMLANAMLALLILQVVLAAAKKVLDLVKDKTENLLDDKAADLLGKLVLPLDKLIELLQGNLNKK